MDPKCNDLVFFFCFVCRIMDNSQEIEQELYDGVDVWDDDECINVFTTDEVRLSLLEWMALN